MIAPILCFLSLFLTAATVCGDTIDGYVLPGLLHASGERLQRHVIESDETWFVVVLETDDVCQGCGTVREHLSSAATKSGGLLNFAFVNRRESILGRDGDFVEVGQEFNLTSIPSIIIYGAGPKRVDTGMRVEGQNAQQFLGGGPKQIYEIFRGFLGSLAKTVRGATLLPFLTRTAPHLPRVVLVTEKAGPMSSSLRKISTDFAGRAIVEQVTAADASGQKLALALGVPAEAFLSDDAGGSAAQKRYLPLLLMSSPNVASHYADLEGLIKTLEPGSLVKPSQGSAPVWRVLTPKDGEALSYEVMRRLLHTNLPLAPVPQVRSQADFERLCSAAPDVSLCFIAILPHDAEAASVAHLKAKGDLATAFDKSASFELVDEDEDEDDDDDDAGAAASEKKGKKSGAGAKAFDAIAKVISRPLLRTDWTTMTQAGSSSGLVAERLPTVTFWIDADEQPELAAALSPTVPSFVGVIPRRNKLAVMRGSFAARNLHEFQTAMVEIAMPSRSKTGNAEADAALAAATARANELVKLVGYAALPKAKTQPPLPASGGGSGKKKATAGGGGAKKTEL